MNLGTFGNRISKPTFQPTLTSGIHSILEFSAQDDKLTRYHALPERNVTKYIIFWELTVYIQLYFIHNPAISLDSN